MKKLLLGSIVLTVFAFAIIAFQLSCQKTANAQTTYTLPAATTSTLGGVIVGSGLSVTSNGTLSVNTTSGGLTQLNKILYEVQPYTGNYSQIQIWMANIDGTGKVQIPIPQSLFPTAGSGNNESIVSGSERLTPDGKTLVFTLSDGKAYTYTIYSISIDGTNLKTVVTVPPTGNFGSNRTILTGVY
ncbi:MAG: hypothetical protein JST29_04910 [Bacteroidetes bacterium]|nr:hypothetical protein [Bacteroidota bacterium]MBS1592049.1 hypothetical protein [Bacteroidota bacterium]